MIISYICINSSKVYCKLPKYKQVPDTVSVLIVAKCIVNLNADFTTFKTFLVLIVAKCIVNF